MMAAARLMAALISFAAGIAVVVYANRLADAPDSWASSWRESLRTEGYVVLLLAVTWLLVGAVTQTPMAALRGARVRTGWLVVAGLVAYVVVIGLAAWPLADFAPPIDPNSTSRRPAGMGYGAFLGSLVLLPALLAVTGAVFLRPEANVSSEPDEVRRADETPVGRILDTAVGVAVVTVLICWVPAWCLLSWILIQSAGNYELPMLPAEGMPVAASGVALAVPTLAAAISIATRPQGRRFAGRLAGCAMALLLFTVLAAQLVRWTDGSLVLGVLFFTVPPVYGRICVWLHKRFGPAGEDVGWWVAFNPLAGRIERER